MSDNINDMHYGSNHFAFEKAREFRDKMTDAEKILWEALRNNQFLGLKFRRQHPINRFVVDFYCHKYKLVIELDGNIHDLAEVKNNDEKREVELKKLGLNILRLKNYEITESLKASLEKIKETIEHIINNTIVR
ncbi:MAG TPA: endonuclease domain-containing protein [Bacteroidales bacterium]|nr:endonuclease domain-containing protein [Bacteroidales bacterium]HPB24548.1 endonuclease domain-containing protein [Bacteroidales bacterium]HQN17282.1 endonuclease domain-containing protein [Bacteroidales bacterium]HQN17283.1 endonuclease domain-containing protein [Bacteroidales bacterium]